MRNKYRDFFWFGCAAIITLMAIAATVALYPREARSEPLGGHVCAPFDKVASSLEKEYQEQMIGAGIAGGNEYVWHLFMHRTGKSWTLLRTDKKGRSCFMAVGTDWSEIDAWKIQPQSITHHQGNPPHNWIQPKMNGAGISCCGPSDIAEIPIWEAAGADIGSAVTAEFPGRGQETITVKKVYPTEDGRAYITRFGCLFKGFGI